MKDVIKYISVCMNMLFGVIIVRTFVNDESWRHIEHTIGILFICIVSIKIHDWLNHKENKN